MKKTASSLSLKCFLLRKDDINEKCVLSNSSLDGRQIREDWSPHFPSDAVFEGRPVIDEEKRQWELEERPF